MTTLAGGRLVAVCERGGWREIPVVAEDVVLWEADLARLGRAVARAFNIYARDGGCGVAGVVEVGGLGGAALPVLLTVQPNAGRMNHVVAELVAQQKGRFVLLAPTGRFLATRAQGLLASVGAGFSDLESILTVMPSGLLVAAKQGAELFGALLPAPAEEISDEDLRRIYGRILLTAKEQSGVREAPLREVFDWYCLKGFSAQEVALKLGCSKATVMNRLATLHKLAGVPAEKLRAYKPFFEQTESVLRDPRARRVRRKDAAYGDDPPEPGEEE